MASGIGIYEKYVSASNLQTQGTLNNRPEPYATGGWLVYCSVAWHSTLALEQSNNFEGVQKLSLKVILGSQYQN